MGVDYSSFDGSFQYLTVFKFFPFVVICIYFRTIVKYITSIMHSASKLKTVENYIKDDCITKYLLLNILGLVLLKLISLFL